MFKKTPKPADAAANDRVKLDRVDWSVRLSSHHTKASYCVFQGQQPQSDNLSSSTENLSEKVARTGSELSVVVCVSLPVSYEWN